MECRMMTELDGKTHLRLTMRKLLSMAIDHKANSGRDHSAPQESIDGQGRVGLGRLSDVIGKIL